MTGSQVLDLVYIEHAEMLELTVRSSPDVFPLLLTLEGAGYLSS